MDIDNVGLLQNVIYFIGTLGILVGLDLLLGAKITSNLKKILDRRILNVDEIMIKISSFFRKTVDTSIDIDEKIVKTKARAILGLLFIAICAAIIFLARKY